MYRTPSTTHPSLGLGVSITIIWDDLALSKSWSNIRYAILIHAYSLTSSLLVTSNNQQAPFTSEHLPSSIQHQHLHQTPKRAVERMSLESP